MNVHVIESHPMDNRVTLTKDNIVQTLHNRMGTGGNNVPLVLFDQQGFDRYGECGSASTLKERDFKDFTDLIVGEGKENRRYIVRRLMPVECARLQGFPDWWDADVTGSDQARYRMWGNGLCLQNAFDVLHKIKEAVDKGM